MIRRYILSVQTSSLKDLKDANHMGFIFSKEYEVASTATPGSNWEDEPKIDYLNIPTDATLGLDLDDAGPTCLSELERAKHHYRFKEFLTWYFKKYESDIDPDYVWGLADGDPLEDLRDFYEWLVYIGEGRYKPDPTAPKPDPVGFGTTWLGTIPYSKNWEKTLEALVLGFSPRDIYVDAGGWIIDFIEPGKLKHIPAKSQFPLEVRLVEGGDDDPESEAGEVQNMENDTGDGETWNYNHSGWDLREEWEEWDGKPTTASEPSGDHLETELGEAMDSPLNQKRETQIILKTRPQNQLNSEIRYNSIIPIKNGVWIECLKQLWWDLWGFVAGDAGALDAEWPASPFGRKP